MRTEDIIKIFKLIQDTFPDCNYQSQDNLIYIRRGTYILHILEFNTLEYYHKTNQLEEELQRLK